MDKTLTALVDIVAAAQYGTLSPSAVRAVVHHTIDTIGCGAGGFASPPASVARAVARGVGGDRTASLYGEPARVLVDQAAFANATANRYLDFNDFGVSGHPSDMIPALIAMTEATGRSGAALVTAIHLAYEVATRLAEAVPPDGGWDQGIYCSLGAAAGLSHLLDLPPDRIAHALSLAAVPAVPLRVTRFGQLSEWKAAATGHAAATATFAVRLAEAGMSGPPEPFEGKDGLRERVWPSFDLDVSLPDPAVPSAIERASLKRHPACYWGQVPIDLALALRTRTDPAAITAIEVRTCANAWRSIGGGRGDAAQKWRPSTRETADHSMPYLMAAALLDGALDDLAFTADRLTDPDLLALIDRITVSHEPTLTDRATRDSCPTEVTAHLADGTALTESAEVPRGHPRNPMSEDEVLAKYHALAVRALSPEDARALGALLTRLPELATVDGVAQHFREFRHR